MSTVNYTGDCEGRNVIGWQKTTGDMDILCLDCAGEDPGENYRPLTENDFRDDEIVTCDNYKDPGGVCDNRICNQLTPRDRRDRPKRAPTAPARGQFGGNRWDVFQVDSLSLNLTGNF